MKACTPKSRQFAYHMYIYNKHTHTHTHTHTLAIHIQCIQTYSVEF